MRTHIDPRLLMNPVHLLSLGFGSGLIPKAPGTAGTLVAIPIYLLMVGLSPIAYLLITLFLLYIGIHLCQATAQRLGVHDHPAIVWDEIVGYLLTMVAVPFEIIWIVAGFALFRLFDVWKPWPIGLLDRRVSGGIGIMLDDLLAAVYASVVLQLVIYLTGGAL
ncbi:MAG: phosphatidylglycerophosphatase A [Thiohalophilus sp.]|uniref:phosphatidylglycerophosphatase A family protein n=1 Tax=Thiohalophilus sp. TaxID=3028392 RepID=UPI0028700A9E|nr:phosphatidylglycerophosphatase A [Thiohalophilus sp.]MDR9435691.1 phosphatidylglycerophosphatase A [Thiohalophilus sp.]